MADETQGGATEAAAETQAKATEAKTAEAKAAEVKTEPTVTITVSQYQAQMERDREYAEYKAAQAAELDKREQARIKAIAEKGDVEKALAETRDRESKRYKELEEKHTGLLRSLADKERDAAIGAFLAGQQFVGETDEVRKAAARDFQDVVRSRFSASQDAAGVWSVVETATGRPVNEVLAEQVKARPYLFAATTQGGANGGGQQLGGQQQADPLQAVGQLYRQELAKQQGFGLARVVG